MLKAALVALFVIFLTGCDIPKVRLTVEARDPQGNVIDRADISNGDTNGRDFRVNGNGSIALTAFADDSGGLSALDIEGGFSCNKNTGGIGSVQQGTFNASDPALPGQHPMTSSFQNVFQVQCSGGTYSASAHVCAKTADGKIRSCTKDATFK